MAINDEIRAKDILPHKTSFASGDGFYGDGDTSFFMEANDLLRLTAENAINSMAQEGDCAYCIVDVDGNVICRLFADGTFEHYAIDTFRTLDVIESFGDGMTALLERDIVQKAPTKEKQGDYAYSLCDVDNNIIESVDADGVYSHHAKDEFDNLDLSKNGGLGARLQAKMQEIAIKGKTTYIVDKNGDGDFTTITAALRALKDDTTPKVIKINAGVYDVFTEQGGQDFIDSIPNTATASDWKTYCDVIPDNTDIVGIGCVVIQYNLPSTTPTNVSNILSPINVDGNFTMENVEIDCENCRYAMHDETSGNTARSGTYRKYKNVKVYKGGEVSLGASCYGAGFSSNTTFEFENCYFVMGIAKTCLYMHTNDNSNDYSSITFNNCVFTTTSSLTCCNFEATTINSSSKVQIAINNCYINAPVQLTATSKPCYIDFTAMKSGVTSVRESAQSMVYTPKFIN